MHGYGMSRIAGVVAGLTLGGSLAVAEPGAQINVGRTDLTLHVAADHPRASGRPDAGRTPEQPLGSLAQAMDIARAHLRDGRSVRIALAAGTYHESLDFRFGDDSPQAIDALLIVEGDPDGGTRLSGVAKDAYPAADWQPVEGHPNVYVHSWAHERGVDWGPWADDYGVPLKGLTARSEMMFANGRRLTPVELEVYAWHDPDGPRPRRRGQEPAGAAAHPENVDGKLQYRGVAEAGWGVLQEPWQFAVADHSQTPEPYRGRIAMRLPDGMTPTDLESIAVCEPADTALRFMGKNNLVVRNLTIERYATRFLQTAFSIDDCNNVLVENVTVRDVGGRGMSLGMCDGVTIRHSRFIHNGQRGFGGTRFTNVLVEACDFSFNNWRGVLSGFTGWDTGGIKVTRSHDSVFLRCTAVGNDAHGFWTDIRNRNVVFDRCFAYGNLERGFFLELSGPEQADGDERITGCVSAYNGEGFVLMNVRRPVLEKSLAINNRDIQISIHRSGERKPHLAEDIGFQIVRNNHAVAQNGTPVIGIPAWPRFGGEDLFTSLRIEANTYASDDPTQAFWREGIGRMDLAEWQSQLQGRGQRGGNDEEATVQQAPAFDSEPIDLLQPDSPYVQLIRRMGVPLPIEAMREVGEVPRHKNKH